MTKLKEDIKRTAKIISLQNIDTEKLENEIDKEVERLIERRFLNKKEDFDKIKNAIKLEIGSEYHD